MRNPEELYELTPAADAVPAGLPLVIGLTGFADAGGAVAQTIEYLRDMLDHEPVAVFDNDILLDYRARRPIVTFDKDHLEDYEPPRLELSLAYDELHTPFLLLSGYEPDFRWEQFAAAVIGLAERLEVSTTTWIHSIPMPVPHTRPLTTTVSGSRADLIEAISVWRPETQVPANVVHLIEYRLVERGARVAGFALLVPHYLADTEYPAAALSALDSISAATGRILPSDELREEGRVFESRVDEQVAENAELQKLVAALEARYDTYMEGNEVRSPLIDDDGEIPSADAIAAELERFLAGRPGDEGEPGDDAQRP